MEGSAAGQVLGLVGGGGAGAAGGGGDDVMAAWRWVWVGSITPLKPLAPLVGPLPSLLLSS